MVPQVTDELNRIEIENADITADVFDTLYTSTYYQQGYYQRFVRLAQSYVSARSAAVFDWGCGTGYLLSLFSRDNYEQLHGMDLSSKMLAAAKQKSGHFKLVVGDGKNLHYTDESFELILALSSLHHTPPDLLSDVLLEMRRCLKTGGYLVIGEPNEQIIFERFHPWSGIPVWLNIRLFRLFGVKFFKDLSHLEPGFTPHHRALTTGELIAVLTQANFNVVVAREPFLLSYAWNAVENRFLMNLAFTIDQFLSKFVRGGRMIYIVAQK